MASPARRTARRANDDDVMDRVESLLHRPEEEITNRPRLKVRPVGAKDGEEQAEASEQHGARAVKGGTLLRSLPMLWRS